VHLSPLKGKNMTAVYVVVLVLLVFAASTFARGYGVAQRA
jgi:hypothetical protein